MSYAHVAAGTNHSKVSGNLRSLATYYAKEPGVLFAVRLAQGLVHAGKGLVTLSPYHPDSSGGVCHQVALAGLLTVLHVCLDFKTIVLGKHHFLLWVLVAAMRPRMLVTVDEDLKPLPVPVRVGQKVDTVGQAGRPKTITGFQTHTTPVLLAMGERAEVRPPPLPRAHAGPAPFHSAPAPPRHHDASLALGVAARFRRVLAALVVDRGCGGSAKEPRPRAGHRQQVAGLCLSGAEPTGAVHLMGRSTSDGARGAWTLEWAR